MSELLKFVEKNRLECGCDEAGRGCLSGPVVAAAVILDPKKPIKGLNDSKQITEKTRNLLRSQILDSALSYGIGIVDHKKIDAINILNASFLAMHLAIENLSISPEFLLIDGNRFHPYKNIPHACMVKGDARFQSIAAASILAKTERDEIMENLHQEFPCYGWDSNKGYPTPFHRDAIALNGPSKYHRMSFQLLPIERQLKLFD